MLTGRVADVVRSHRWLAGAVALGLVLLGSLSLAGSYRALERETHQSTHERWAEEASYSYVVPVVRNATHWPIGTQLPMGMPAYYRTVSDGFALDFSWRAPNAAGSASADMLVRIVASAPDGRAYWTIEHPLAQAASADGAIDLSTRVDMDALVEEETRVGRELPPGEGRVDWTIEATVAYDVTAEGQREVAKSVYRFPIVVQDPRFILPQAPDAAWRNAHSEERTWTTEQVAGAAGALADLKGLGLTLAGGALLALVAWLAWGDPLRRLATRDAAYVREHQRHREWVTTVAGPIDVSSFPAAVVDVGDLETLIETAADARCRVLHDHALRIYYAVLPNATYRYARHAR